MADELIIHSSLNKSYVPVTQTQQLVYVLISAKPSRMVAKSRMSLNFGFVLDRSGSMRGDKIKKLQQAMALALGRMAPDDLVSITVFNDNAQVLASAGKLSKQGSLLKKVQRIRAGGGTQMSRGMSLGLREVYQNYKDDRVNQLLLITDGQTYGDEAHCIKLAREAGQHHIAIQALGLGDDWNEELLDDIGQRSQGRFGSDRERRSDRAALYADGRALAKGGSCATPR